MAIDGNNKLCVRRHISAKVVWKMLFSDWQIFFWPIRGNNGYPFWNWSGKSASQLGGFIAQLVTFTRADFAHKIFIPSHLSGPGSPRMVVEYSGLFFFFSLGALCSAPNIHNYSGHFNIHYYQHECCLSTSFELFISPIQRNC